jgi:hypothetical protein
MREGEMANMDLGLSPEDLKDAIAKGVRRALMDVLDAGRDRDAANRALMEAIRGGVHDAIWHVATNATGMPSADFYDSVKDGVKEAMERLKPEEPEG